MGTRFLLFIFFTGLIFFSSCTSTKSISYFQTDRDTTFKVILDTIESPIEKNNILSINISSLNRVASADFNSTEKSEKGYLVNNDGNIELPILGSIRAEGLTKTQLKEVITKMILDKGLLIDPIVEIRHINYEVTVLGEVASPTVITVPSEKISMVKALGLAGDLTIYGKRDNVLLIREEDGKRTTHRINLNSVDFLNSPYYYLKPNDLVYVEPNKSKIASTDRVLLILPIILSSLSIVLIVLGFFNIK
jgi:polysaccharide export outer membrane protein